MQRFLRMQYPSSKRHSCIQRFLKCIRYSKFDVELSCDPFLYRKVHIRNERFASSMGWRRLRRFADAHLKHWGRRLFVGCVRSAIPHIGLSISVFPSRTVQVVYFWRLWCQRMPVVDRPDVTFCARSLDGGVLFCFAASRRLVEPSFRGKFDIPAYYILLHNLKSNLSWRYLWHYLTFRATTNTMFSNYM